MKVRNWMAFMFSFCLVATVNAQDSVPENWFNLDKSSANVQGVSTEKVYTDIIKGRKGRTVIVAVIDSGVDANHEDLKEVMWVNPGEIAGNGIDDDKNGYVDDIHGWNFIGGKDGKNVKEDNLEVARVYKKLSKKYEGKTAAQAKDKKEYAIYLKAKKEIEEGRETAGENIAQYESMLPIIMESLNAVDKLLDGKKPTSENIQNLDVGFDRSLAIGQSLVLDVLSQGGTFGSLKEIKEEMSGQIQADIDRFSNQLKYSLNPDFDSRTVIGDNYANQTEKDYGNNDVQGPDARHGTHVAGIIGAARNNDIGMNGVANNVRIMSIRAVPDGDERDKDVANAIRYAVDNGASVVNMSFGKGFSWNKKIVDDALRYAEKKDVLLVHAAGNSHMEVEPNNNYPNDKYEKKKFFGKKKARNWIEVGALSWKGGEDAVATFSNYDKENVDLFAPGVAIYSTIPDNKYENLQGTSMASPVVAGVAALIRSQFPKLTARQVKNILMDSVTPLNSTVIKPGSGGEKVPFSSLSVTGGVINAFDAVKKASQVKGKKKGVKGLKGSSGNGKSGSSKKKEKVA